MGEKPSKKEMLECFDGMCLFLANHGWTERDERAVAIRQLIEEAYKIPDTSEREAELEEIIIKMQEQIDKLQHKVPPSDKSIEQENLLGQLGAMYSYAMAYMQTMEISKKKQEEFTQAHRQLRQLTGAPELSDWEQKAKEWKDKAKKWKRRKPRLPERTENLEKRVTQLEAEATLIRAQLEQEEEDF